MATDKRTLSNEHNDHVNWMSQLNLYKDELKIYQDELQDVSSKNTAQDIKKDVEHFQNQFIIQKNELDSLIHDIRLEEHKIADDVRKNPNEDVTEKTMADNSKLRERYETFSPIFEDMKKEFKEFLNRTL